MQTHPLETVPENETADIKKLLKLQMMFMKADESKRGQHAKSHGCVRVEFQVREDVPAQLRVGLFAEPGTYSGLVRFSNGGGADDTGKDAHGLALKLLDVPGDQCLPERDAETQDFILADCPVFFCKNPGDLAAFMQAQIKARGGPPTAWFDEHPDEARIFQEQFLALPGPSLLVMNYFSQTPYLLGDRAVKYYATPAAANDPGGAGPGTTPDFLRERLATSLGESAAAFEFGVQVQSSPDVEPVEDPTSEWSSQRVPLGEIRIPSQTFSAPEVLAFDENLSFSPWHALEAHRPLGGINRARRVIYEASSSKRHEVNGAAVAEPTAADLPF